MIEHAPGSRVGFDSAFRFLGAVVAQSTVLAALLFYFGWLRTRETLRYFGINGELAEFSATDYILRSVGATFRPLVIIGIIALAALFVHSLILPLLLAGHGTIIKAVRICVGTIGLVAIYAGLLGFSGRVRYDPKYVHIPVLLAAGVILVGYATHARTWARIGAYRQAPSVGQHQDFEILRPSDRVAAARWATLIAFLVLMAFWEVSLYAPTHGQRVALDTYHKLSTRVDVFSDRSLDLTGPGVTYSLLPAGGRFRYRYTGMLLLLYSHGRYFLLPDGWRPRNPVYLLEEGPGIRMEFRARWSR